MAFFALDLYLASRGRSATGELVNVSAFLAQPGSWRMLADLVGLAMAGGLFTVPLYAMLQHESEPAHRARVIAANNIINALAMSRGCGRRGRVPRARPDDGRAVRAVRRRDAAGCARRGVDPATHAGEEPGAARPSAALPRRGRRASSTRDAAMPHAVIAANHASFLDGLLLGAFLPGEPIFAVDTLIAKQVVGQAVPAVRQRAAGRSDQPAVDPRDDPRGRGAARPASSSPRAASRRPAR